MIPRRSRYWAPVINIARDSRWGRNIECPGEDPYLSGEYGTHFVRGFQQAPEAPGTLLAVATCKRKVHKRSGHCVWLVGHSDRLVAIADFVANSMEKSCDDGVCQ